VSGRDTLPQTPMFPPGGGMGVQRGLRSAPSLGAERFGAWRRSGFRSIKLSATTKLDTKHKTSFKY